MQVFDAREQSGLPAAVCLPQTANAQQTGHDADRISKVIRIVMQVPIVHHLLVDCVVIKAPEPASLWVSASPDSQLTLDSADDP